MNRKNYAKHTKASFYDHKNNINIFIEDTDVIIKKVYHNLFSCIDSDYFKVKEVFPIGNRNAVIKAANENISKEDNIYIIDGDLYLLCGEKEKINANILVLDKYCIENYLLKENYLLEIMLDEDHYKDRNKLKELLNYSDWLEKNSRLLGLFAKMSVSHSLNLGCPTISLCKVKEMIDFDILVDNNFGNIKQEFFEKVENSIFNCLSDENFHLFQSEVERIKRKFSGECIEVMKYISGKDVLLPIMYHKISRIIKKKKGSFRISTNDFKVRLSRKIEENDIFPLIQKILMIRNRKTLS